MDTDRFIDYLKSVLLTSDELLAAVDLMLGFSALVA